MAPPTFAPRFTRRDGLRLAAAMSLAGPGMPGAIETTSSQESDAYAGHPAVGAWLAEFRGYQPPAYVVLHDDGTGTFFTAGTAYFTTVSDPALPMSGVIVWEPVDDIRIEAMVYVTWGDATDETTMTIRQQWTFDEDGDAASALTRTTHVDADGTVINRSSDRFDVTRLDPAPFEQTATPQASPVS